MLAARIRPRQIKSRPGIILLFLVLQQQRPKFFPQLPHLSQQRNGSRAVSRAASSRPPLLTPRKHSRAHYKYKAHCNTNISRNCSPYIRPQNFRISLYPTCTIMYHARGCYNMCYLLRGARRPLNCGGDARVRGKGAGLSPSLRAVAGTRASELLRFLVFIHLVPTADAFCVPVRVQTEEDDGYAAAGW